MTAKAYDIAAGEDVNFESDQGCCPSCVEDEAYYFEEVPWCCCIHQKEASDKGLLGPSWLNRVAK